MNANDTSQALTIPNYIYGLETCFSSEENGSCGNWDSLRTEGLAKGVRHSV